MAFDKFLDRAKNLAKDPKVREKLNSEKAEKASDSILDKAAGAAESLTGGKHTEKIQKARDAADNAIGTEGKTDPGSADDTGDQHGDQHGEGARDDRPDSDGHGPR